MKESTSEYMYKTSCEACGSSDGRAVYSDSGSHCFVCSNTIRGDKDTFKQSGQVMKKKEFEPQFITYPNSIRGISKTTLEKFTYGVANGKHVTYYYNKDGDITAEKYRSKDKKFGWSGNAKEATLFGQNVWTPSEKIKLIIVEGEIDAMSVSEIQGNRFPVVSLANGAASAVRDIKANYDYVSKFKEVILMLDMDTAGKKAAKDVQEMFKTGYCKIAKLPLKDASEMLVAGRGKELISAIFQAEANVPEEICTGNKLVDLLDKIDDSESYAYPDYLPKLSNNIKGLRMGDLTVVAAGTSSGKSTFLRQLALHFNDTTDFNQGLLFLEEGVRFTMESIVSIRMKRQLHLEDKSNEDPEVRKTWLELANAKDEDGNNRLSILDSFGSLPTDKLYDMIRYMAKVDKCRIIYLDHISILVSGMDGSVDQRIALDSIMTNLASLTQELGVHIYAVSHLNNNTGGGKPYEEGGTATVNSLRGSGGIKQLADNIITLSRDQMSECITTRNTTKVSLLKCRHTGNTGICDSIVYSSDTGVFTEVTEEFTVDENSSF